MSIYLIPIQTAILLFPLLAALITIPYIIVQYRRYGAVTPLRVLIVYSFIFYLLCAYFMVILPLPPMEEVAKYTTPTMQLVPLQCLKEFSLTTSLVWNNPSTYLAALNEPSLFLIMFNILLTVPFGVYLRYYFSCSWKKTLLLSFLLTLSFESIQLSALFGIYPRPYRLFDVDDLINNTLGGMLGYALAPTLAHFLPTREKLDRISLTKGRQVTWLRRMSAFFIDLFIIALLTVITLFILVISNTMSIDSLSTNALYVYAFYAVLCIMVLSIITHGKTLGKAIVNIRLVNAKEKAAAWYHIIVHYGVIYLLVLPCPYIIFISLVHYLNFNGLFTSDLLIIPICLIFYTISLVHILQSLFRRNRYTWYDRRWKLHNISTIEVADEAKVPNTNDDRNIELPSENV